MTLKPGTPAFICYWAAHVEERCWPSKSNWWNPGEFIERRDLCSGDITHVVDFLRLTPDATRAGITELGRLNKTLSQYATGEVSLEIMTPERVAYLFGVSEYARNHLWKDPAWQDRIRTFRPNRLPLK